MLLQDVPDDQGDETRGEASLRGHLKNGEDEKRLSAYVPTDEGKDKQLSAAIEFLHGKSKAQIVAAVEAAKLEAAKVAAPKEAAGERLPPRTVRRKRRRSRRRIRRARPTPRRRVD